VAEVQRFLFAVITMSNLNSSETAIIEALLSHASDDYVGLWEAIPIVRSVSNVPEAELLTATKAILSKMWEGGALDFIWGHPNPNPEEVLTPEEIDAVLEDIKEWSGDRPYRGRMVWISSRAA
jgi:hypothetical protein